MRSAPLNIFQKLMRKWELVHPYNAAQVMQIAGNADPATVASAWESALADTGLGRLRFDGGGYSFEILNGQADPFGVVFPHTAFAEHLSLELNRPFDQEREPPFRPFVIREAAHFFAGVVYQHWVADSASIRMLLREWLVRLYDPPAARRRPLELPSSGYWEKIGPRRGGWQVVESALGMIRRYTRMRRVQKIASTNLDDHRTQFSLFAARDGLIDPLRRFANDRGAKLNDVFLAALAEACALHVPLQRRTNRADMAVGSIVDLRPFCPDDLSQVFGLFLGFTNVVCRPHELAGFERLLRTVSNQTKLQKQTGVAPASLIWMGAAMTIGKLSRPEELYHFYRKELPLAGGISNVDMSKTWAAQYHPAPLLDYIRISPTGPMTPLVLTTTTLGEKFHLGLTHRSGLIPPEQAAAVAQDFLARLERCAKSAR